MAMPPPGGWSIAEFCKEHSYDVRTYRSLKKRKLMPRETLMPESKCARILLDDYLAWLELIRRPECQLKEYERRRAIMVRVGRAAARAPGHPAQVWDKFRRAGLTADKPKSKPNLRKLQAAE